MLKRTQFRRYLKAVLWHDNIPQSEDCSVGLLIDNCTEKTRAIFDTTNDQLVTDSEGRWAIDKINSAVAFEIGSVTHDANTTGICATTITFMIHIYSRVSSGNLRQDELDKIEERIWHRLYCYVVFEDATTGERLQPIFRSLRENKIGVSVREEAEFEGNYTVRTLDFTITTKECISRTECHDSDICFNFDELTRLDDCNG